MKATIGQSPKVTWRADGVPEAPAFGDAYFGSADALHEIAHVFLNGTGLWHRLVAGPRDRPVHIGETGFGTGLNFCAAVQLWLACRQAGADVPPLHFTSIEAFPLARADLAQALKPFQDVVAIADELVAAWPEGFEVGELYSASFLGGEVRLSIKIDEAAAGLQNLTVPGGVDIWFLDGFAPEQNPEMWRTEVIRELGRLSAPKAHLATFTAAGHVRRALEGAGFAVSRVKGHGRKRHMTVAEFVKTKTKLKAPSYPSGQAITSPRIAIIGGGLAGHVLVERAHHHLPNAKITLFDEDFSGSAAPPVASVVPRLDVGEAAHAWLMPRLFNFATRYWTELAAKAENEMLFRPIGAHYKSDDPKALERAHRAAPQMGGEVRGDGGVFWPTAGVVESKVVFDSIRRLAHPHCEERKVQHLDRIAADFDHIILAAGAGNAAFLPSLVFPVTGRAGSLCRFAGVETPPHILYGAGHILPGKDNGIWTGASFEHWTLDGPPPVPHDFQQDADAGRARITKLMGAPPSGEMDDQWAGLRVVTPDQLPLAGPLPIWAQLAEGLQGLRHGQWLDPAALQAAFAYNHGARFHILGGLGARGFLWAPMLADRVIRGLAGQVLDGGEAVAQALAPWRFLVREERYGRLTGADALPSTPIL